MSVREAIAQWVWDDNQTATEAILRIKVDGNPLGDVLAPESAGSVTVDHLPVGSSVTWALVPFNGQEEGPEVTGFFDVIEPAGPVKPDAFTGVSAALVAFHDAPEV